MKNLINNEFKITSILGKGYHIDSLTASLVDQFKNKNVLLFQDKNLYHSCKRLQLCFGIDLINQIDYFADEFDVLIIDKIKDYVNAHETINLFENISQSEKLKDKQFIFIFTSKTDKYNIDIKDFPNLGNAILRYSDNIYALRQTEHDFIKGRVYKLENIQTQETHFLSERPNGVKIIMEEANE
ncbi:MAG: hypothetical protein IJW36_03335 [Clostridia bacterium]|nr:hypothetical protein [Clostridia bacterium]